MTDQNTIPNTLRHARRQTGLTQLQVAQKLGLASADRISRWEKGRTFPHVVNLIKLCAIYKTLPHEVYAELFLSAAEGRLLPFCEGEPSGDSPESRTSAPFLST